MASSPTLTRRHFLAGSACLVLGHNLPVHAHSQGTPMPTTATGTMVTMRLERLPARHVNTFLARYELDPEGHVPAFTRVGTALLVPESGSIAITSDVPPKVRLSRGATATPTTYPTNGDIVLHAGDGVLVPHGARMSLRNYGGEPASLLALVVYGPYHEFSYTHPTELPDMTGVTRRVIGFGTGAFTEGPATLIIERVIVRPRASAYSTTFRGIEMGVIEAGDALATIRSGDTWTTPAAINRVDIPIQPGTTRVEPGSRIRLNSTDGYVCQDGSINWRATGAGPLVVLRAQMIPIPIPVG